MMIMIKSVICRIGKEFYAIDVTNVLSIERMHSIRPLAQQAFHVAGIMQLRGEVLPVFDLRKWLGVHIEDTEEQKIIVVSHQDKKVGLIVDSAMDVVDIDDDSIQEVSSDQARVEVQQVVSLQEKLVLIFDVVTLLQQIA